MHEKFKFLESVHPIDFYTVLPMVLWRRRRFKAESSMVISLLLLTIRTISTSQWNQNFWKRMKKPDWRKFHYQSLNVLGAHHAPWRSASGPVRSLVEPVSGTRSGTIGHTKVISVLQYIDSNVYNAMYSTCRLPRLLLFQQIITRAYQLKPGLNLVNNNVLIIIEHNAYLDHKKSLTKHLV